MPKHPLAAVTMVYNEPDLLPVWLRHYARAIGEEHCYVIDHGSTEGLDTFEAFPRAHVARLPRTPMDEAFVSRTQSHFCAQLLSDYDWVARTDVDELLVPDPRRAASLPALCGETAADVLTALGLDVVHVEEEPRLDLSRPVSVQRKWARASWGVSKPALIRRPVHWGFGCHLADAPSVFGGLYLFHLAFADFGVIKRRQRKRVKTERLRPEATHHNMSADDMVWHVRRDYLPLPRVAAPTLGGLPEDAFIARLFEAGTPWHGGTLIGAGVQAEVLWEIPDRFRGRF